MKNRPRPGIGVIVKKEDKILFGKRKGNHGDGTWSFPGGHLEFFESFEYCAKREVKEETNLEIENIKFVTTTNDIFKNDNKHYVMIFMESDYKSGVLSLMEPKRCYEWCWYKWNDMPSPLFLPVKNLIKKCYDPFREY